MSLWASHPLVHLPPSQGHVESARARFATAQRMAPQRFEPFVNGALAAKAAGNMAEAYALATRALDVNPEHGDTQKLLAHLQWKLGTML